MSWLDRMAENVVGKIILSILLLAMGLIPTWIGWGVWVISGTATFWESFAVIGLLFYFLAGIQLFLLIGFCAIVGFLWLK